MIAPDVVEVGREYAVSCILDNGRWLPVFPKPHADDEPEFFVNVPEHFHYDNRFIETRPESAIRSMGQPMDVRPFVAVRETHTPPQNIIWMHLALLKHFRGHRIGKDCHTCPHKGMPIINGVCAGHGLKWNADGYLKHRGPFKLRWAGNVGEITNLRLVEIPITVAADAPFVMDILDAEGEVVFTHAQTDSFQINALPGDLLKINNRNIEMIREGDKVDVNFSFS